MILLMMLQGFLPVQILGNTAEQRQKMIMSANRKAMISLDRKTQFMGNGISIHMEILIITATITKMEHNA